MGAIARRALRPGLLLCCAALLAGCYARSTAIGGALRESRPAPLPLLAAVRAGPEGANVPRIHAASVVARFAAALEASGLFRAVVFPWSELARVEPDLLLEVAVRSAHDRHVWRNRLADLAVGASALLLQPLLPTRYDLRVELDVRARAPRATGGIERRGAALQRFESTWLAPPESALARWHDDAAERAVAAAVAALSAERAALLALAGGGPVAP